MSLAALSPQQALVLSAVRQFPGRNARALAEAISGDAVVLRRRLPELHERQLIYRDSDGGYWPAEDLAILESADPPAGGSGG